MKLSQNPDGLPDRQGDSPPSGEPLPPVYRFVVAALIVPVVVLVALVTRDAKIVAAFSVCLLGLLYWLSTGKVRPPAG